MEYRSGDLSNPARNVYGEGIDEPSEWGHRKMDGQAREGNGRAERERTSQILMRYDPSFNPALTYYYQQDHEGSVTHLLNTSGTVVESYKYDAFGLPTIYDKDGILLSASAKSNRFLFTGREYANLFGFYEYRARAYHPTLGRFMSEDPKGFVHRVGLAKPPSALEKPDDWSFATLPDEAELNLFRYCGNDPIDFTDPMGLDWYDAPHNFIVGAANALTFNQAEKVGEFLSPGYIAATDKSSMAYRLGEPAGLMGGMMDGSGEIGAIRKGSAEVASITRSSLSRIKALIRNLSKRDRNPGLSKEKLGQLKKIAEKAGGTVRTDLKGVKGTGVQPHAHVEGLGPKTANRNIWLEKERQ